MNDAKEQGKTFLKEYLENQGINTHRNFRCLNPEHEDKNPSMSFNGKNNTVHCFSCNANYDIYDLIKQDYNVSFSEALDKICDMFELEKKPFKKKEMKVVEEKVNLDFLVVAKDDKGEAIRIKDTSTLYEYCKNNKIENPYLNFRCISNETANKYNVIEALFLVGNTHLENCVIIPTSQNTFIVRNTKMNEKFFNKLGGASLFNVDILKESDKPIFVAESEIDALSLLEIGLEAIALGGVNNYTKLIKYLKENNIDNTLILILDNDASGIETTKKIAEELAKLNINYHDATDLLNDLKENNVIENYKDVNEMLMKIDDKEKFIKKFRDYYENVLNNAIELEETKIQEYYENSVKNKIQDFINGISENINTPPTETGFKKLDDSLNGGLYEGLYILGAISSLGKTTLTLQIADNIAREQEKDILVFSLEMSANELIAKSISRLSYELASKKSFAKSTRGITDATRYKDYNENETDLIKESFEAYANYKGNIFIYEGVGNIGVEQIRKKVNDHKSITGKTPIIIIDYIQLLAPYNERATDKQNTDKNILELKRLSRDFKASIIGISSLNRASYDKEINMSAFKESGAIEYSSDVLIGLQFKNVKEEKDNEQAKMQDIRKVEMKILKNRNGRTGDIINFDYLPIFNYFKEL